MLKPHTPQGKNFAAFVARNTKLGAPQPPNRRKFFDFAKFHHFNWHFAQSRLAMTAKTIHSRAPFSRRFTFIPLSCLI